MVVASSLISQGPEVLPESQTNPPSPGLATANSNCERTAPGVAAGLRAEARGRARAAELHRTDASVSLLVLFHVNLLPKQAFQPDMTSPQGNGTGGQGRSRLFGVKYLQGEAESGEAGGGGGYEDGGLVMADGRGSWGQSGLRDSFQLEKSLAPRDAGVRRQTDCYTGPPTNRSQVSSFSGLRIMICPLQHL